ncbi:MAG: hypothetical protein QOI02_781, partial [Actinomycetota bacterium]|nr:hypothetical protein [Actinomycetota bacterium]
VGLFFCWLPAMLGIIFGCVGLSTANRLNGLNKAAATWAIILGASPIPIVILQVIVGAAIGSATQ